MMLHSPNDYITRIEEMYDECRSKHLGRLSVEWGSFSRGMNLELQTDMQNAKNTNLRSRFNYVFVFWIEMSKCLDQFIPNLHNAKVAKDQALSKDPLEFDLDEANKFQMIFGR
ncbi:MAG: hypothetical protein SVK08_01985 [Halobacteriota archaeon]|nr:hypothetical protein [Halobacteriota archaeon]